MNFSVFTNQFNNINLSSYYKLIINNKEVGYLNVQIKEFILTHYKEVFFEDNRKICTKARDLSFKVCTQLFQDIADALLKYQIIPCLRNEYILVTDLTISAKLMKVDRSIAHLFGFISQGVHINVFVKRGNEHFLWISKRGNTTVEPFKFDSSIAGAMSYGYTAKETVIKEGKEEANLDENTTSKAMFSRSLAYKIEKYGGLRNDIMHIFHLEVEDNIRLEPYDNEAEKFYLWDINYLQQHMINNLSKYKYNSVLSMLSFLIEKKLIDSSCFNPNLIGNIINNMHNKAKLLAINI